MNELQEVLNLIKVLGDGALNAFIVYLLFRLVIAAMVVACVVVVVKAIKEVICVATDSIRTIRLIRKRLWDASLIHQYSTYYDGNDCKNLLEVIENLITKAAAK